MTRFKAAAAVALLLGLATPWAATAQPAANRLTPAEAKAGWRLLFNGRDFTGWRNWKGQGVRPRWKVEDGAIVLTGFGGGDILTTESFKDFELKVDWKISPGGNSGIMYFVRETPVALAPWNTGPEMQVLDDERHPDGRNGPDRHAGALYDLAPPAERAARPVGAWNEARVVVRDGRIEHWLNGRRVVATSWGDPAWKALVAGSKFATMPDFATVAEGHIALQDHGDRVWFRNIKLRPLP